MNISMIMIDFPNTDKLGVIPVERPTVPKADTTSNIIAIKSKSSVTDNNIVEKIIKNNAIQVIVIAFITILLDIRFLYNVISSCPFMVEKTTAKRTPNVVVFIPPPVELGDAPMAINIIVRNRVVVLKWDILRVLNPAVLVEIEVNKELNILSENERCCNVHGLLYSKIKKDKAPPNINVDVTAITNFVCKDHFAFFMFILRSKSIITGNPKPPKITNNIIVQETIQSKE